MGGPLVDSSEEGVSSSLSLCHSTCEKAGFEHSSCAWSEDENFDAGIAGGKDDLVVEEIGTALAQVMHVYGDDDENEGTDPGEDSDENDDSLLSLESDSTEDLVDIDTELVASPAFPSGNASESSIGKLDEGNSSTNGTPMLVSAIKGNRAKRGIVTRLSVSWAPDVYDPPVTSESHTVRAHQRSSRKGHYKYKSSKSSSSSSSSSSRSSNGSKKDKKHSRHSSSSSSSSKRDRKPSYRSTNGGSSSRTDTSAPQYCKVYGSSSSRTDSSVPQYCKASPSVPAECASLAEPVPVLKTMEQIKRSTSCCKEQPLSMLSRQFVAARYKGMFSLWSQNQLAS